MSDQPHPTSAGEITELLAYLTQTNPYFALWGFYKRSVCEHPVAGEWRQFLLERLGSESQEEIEVACAMLELDKLLSVYREQNCALPILAFERICFLHCIRGPERMAQTQAILGTLTAELAACMSA